MLSYHIKFKNVLDTHVYFIQYMPISQGRHQDFGSGGTSDKISYIKSFQVLYCNGVAKISVRGGGGTQQECTHQRLLKNFEKFIKNLQNNLKHFPKFFKIKI